MVTIFYGLDFTDSFFHINEALHPVNDDYRFSFLLSSIFIKAVSGLFGDQLIWFRMINGILLLIPGVISFFYVKRKMDIIQSLLYGTILLFISSSLNTNILGFDTFSTLLLSLIFFTSLDYLEKNSVAKILLLSFLTVAAILTRFPNFVVLLVISGFLFYDERNSNLIKTKAFLKPVFYLLFSMFLTVLVYSLYYSDFVLVIKEEFDIAGHETTHLLKNYLNDFYKLIAISLYFLTSYEVFKFCAKKVRKPELVYIPFFIIQLLISFGIASLTKYNFTLYFVSIVLSFAVIFFKEKKSNFPNREFIILILYVICMFVNPFGSNTGLIKASFLFILFPFIAVILKPTRIKFWVGTLIVTCFLGITNKVLIPYEDANFLKLNNSVNIPKLSQIRTQGERSDYLEDVDKEIAKLLNEDINPYFYGSKSHIFNYLYPFASINIKDFNQDLMNSEINPKMQRLMKSKEKIAIFLTYKYPENSYYTDLSALEERLLNEGFEKISKGKILYYIRN
ncbi:glycosyltransferase family protein [Gillisia mitskevichiae]|uniref:glycosyltransferase family 39 protein n=1 Tax=Gillisia mitskevichiae TaxID=270921 RepID=UPI001602615E|nr:glycosyltransferase family 39 protein [Gillisia mitskevichiae]